MPEPARFAQLAAVLAGLAWGMSACGTTPTAASDTHVTSRDDPGELGGEPSAEGGGVDSEGERAPEPAAARPQIELDVQFHRTKGGPGPGFWVLAEIHNQHPDPIDALEARVALLDEAGELATEVRVALEHGLETGLAPDERRMIAVPVAAPVAHEDLNIAVFGSVREVELEALPETLILEYDPPRRAELGGWAVAGWVRNEGETAVEIEIEVQGLDSKGQLLGLDWLELGAVGAGESRAFDVGGMRYEQVPKRFELALR